MSLKPGDVLKLFIEETTPPKFKFIVIIGRYRKKLVYAYVFINSQVNPNVNWSTDLKAQQLEIRSSDHPFLNYNSYVDCSRVHDFPEGELLERISQNPDASVGRIQTELFDLILKQLKHSPTIKGKIKKRLGLYD